MKFSFFLLSFLVVSSLYYNLVSPCSPFIHLLNKMFVADQYRDARNILSRI